MKDDVPTPATPSPAPATLTYAGPRKETPWQPERPNDGLPERDPKRYVVVGEHGRGGLGRVLEAYDSDLERTVAVKELLEPSNRAEARFVREAKITARLEHPGIVPVHDAGRWPNGSPFYSMKLVSGRPLRDVLAERKTLSERLPLIPNVLAVADAIAYAHSKRIIHRDLKPSNVIIGEFGETVVIDWGLAKDLSLEVPEPDVDVGPYRYPQTDDVTVAGDVIGTPGYMPPEQARGEPVDERADIYALGAILYHVLVGEAPYTAPTSEEILQELLSSAPVSVTERVPGAPADLAAIVDKAMARDPHARYAHAAELAADLKRFQSGQLVTAHLYTSGELARRWLRRYRVPVAITSIAAAILVVFGTVAVRRIIAASNEARDRAREVQSQLALSYFDQGRRALLDGDHYAALVFLNEALQLGYDTDALHMLFGRAARPFEALVGTLAHDGPVWWAEFSPDDTTIVTASADGTLSLWDAFTGKRLRRLTGHHGQAFRAWFDASGDRIVSIDSGGIALLWDARNGDLLRRFEGHEAGLSVAEVSPDGAALMTGGYDGTIRVWNIASGEMVAVLRLGDQPMEAAFVGNGERVVAIDGVRAAVFDVPAAREIASIDIGPTEGAGLAGVTKDGNLAVFRVGSHLATWDLVTGGLRTSADRHDGFIIHAKLDNDERYVVTASEDATAGVWDLASLRRLQTLVGHEGMVNYVEVIGDGSALLTSSWDGTARVWDMTGGVASLVIPAHAQPANGAFASTDGMRIVTTSWDGSAKLWNLGKSGNVAQTLRAPRRIRALAASVHGSMVAVLEDETAYVWDLEVRSGAIGHGHASPTTRAPGPLLRCPGGLSHADFLADGDSIIGLGKDRVCVWKTRGSAEPTVVEFSKPLRFIGPGPRDLFVVVDDYDRVGIWRVGSPSPAAELVVPGVSRAAIGPRGDVLAAVVGEQLQLWNIAGGGLQQEVAAHSHACTYVAFSGDRVLTGGFDSVVRIWSGTDLSLVGELRADGAWLEDAKVAPARPFVLTSLATRHAVVWDLDTSSPLVDVQKATATTFVPDVSAFAVASGDRVSFHPLPGRRWRPAEADAFVACAVPAKLPAAILSNAARQRPACEPVVPTP